MCIVRISYRTARLFSLLNTSKMGYDACMPATHKYNNIFNPFSWLGEVRGINKFFYSSKWIRIGSNDYVMDNIWSKLNRKGSKLSSQRGSNALNLIIRVLRHSLAQHHRICSIISYDGDQHDTVILFFIALQSATRVGE